MKYLFILMILLTSTLLYSQDLKQFKNTESIEIIIRGDSTIYIENEKQIKTVLKELKYIVYSVLKRPEQWFKEDDWLIRINFDSNRFTFYDGGYIRIGDETFYTSQNEIEEFKEMIIKNL